MSNKSVVILCGGKGSRMGTLTSELPKPMVNIQGKPIVWYIYNLLYLQGVRNFYFITGYKHKKVSAYIKDNFTKDDTCIYVIDTGENTEIAQRLDLSLNQIEDDVFLLVNGDTIFDFDINDLYEFHRKGSSLVLTSIPVTSKYGLIIQKDGKLVSFERESKVKKIILENDLYGFVNSGISLINKSSLLSFNLKNCLEYESEFYSYCINNYNTSLYEINGFWYAFDTPKDVAIANAEIESKENIFEKINSIKKKIGVLNDK